MTHSDSSQPPAEPPAGSQPQAESSQPPSSQSMSWSEFAARIRALARAPTGPEGVDTRLRHRLRLTVSCLLLVTAAFSIAPGKIISDTKLDMAINPGGFLARALHLWDANEHFGQLQNQAYGYLFPMGPFYLLGKVAGVAPWVTQRLWVAAVLCAAFLGVVKLAEALDIGSPNARLLAGFAYALAPRAQELVAINSSEFLPTAVLPWMLLPLVKCAQGGFGPGRGAAPPDGGMSSPRRAAALSALALVFCGGINAAAEVAVLAVPAVYLLTRSNGARKWRLIGWWVPCVALASFWWAIPLLVMGRYGFKFIDYVESAGTTTQTTSLTNIMRGASNWVGHVPVDGLPWWPAGYTLSTEPWLIVLTGLVAGLGVIGLCRRGLPERTFLVLTVLLGVAIIVTGHRSVIAPPFADSLRALFDGVLAAFRNIHKFDALVRLPLALGLAHLVVSPLPKWRPALTLVTLGAVAGTFVPVLSAGLAARGSFRDIPGYWREAATWINRNAGENTVLAVPGARFGEYTWGRPIDEPMQPLLKARWSSRMIVPWGSAGLARLMEGIDERFATGRGSPGLAQVLSRMGVRFLLVRNDLDQTTTRGAWPGRVHEALRESLGPQAKPVKQYGPSIGAPFNADATTSLYQPYKALEIYEVPRAAALVNTVSTTRPLRVTGGPEALLTLADQGLLSDDRPVLFNEDGDAADTPASDTVVTDTLRRREVNFADTTRGSSPTMTESDRYRGSSKVKDLVEPGWDRYGSVARLYGIRSVTASSSSSDITSLPETRTAGQQPYAALDGDQRTYWASGGWYGAEGEWLRVQFREPRRLDKISVAFKQGALFGPPVGEVTVETEQGRVPRQRVRAVGTPQQLETPGGASDWLRIRVDRLAERPKRKLGTKVAISEVSVPGVQTGRAIVTPPLRNAPTGSGSPTVALTGLTGTAAPCMLGSRSWACSQQLDTKGEDGNAFDRVFPSNGGPKVITGTAVLTDPGSIQQYTTFGANKLTASSSIAEHPAALGRSAYDADRATTWVSDPLERQPSLNFEFGRQVTLSQIKFIFPYETNPAPATQVALAAEKPGDLRSGWIGKDGVLRFAPVKTSRLVVKFLQGGSPVQITEMEIPGVLPYQAPRNLQLKTQCGTGPTFLVEGGFPVPTRLTAGTVGDLLDGNPVPFVSCDAKAAAEAAGGKPPRDDQGATVLLPPGNRRILVNAADPFRIAGAVIRPAGEGPPPKATVEPMQVLRWGPEVRSVEVQADRESYLVVNDNFNAGWQARLDGARLRAVRLDGWRQAWIVPANTTGTVELRYLPDLPYRIGLLGGFLLIMLMIVFAVLPSRLKARGPATPPLAPTRVHPRLLWPIALALGFWTGGIFGLIGVTVMVALLARARVVLARAALSGVGPPGQAGPGQAGPEGGPSAPAVRLARAFSNSLVPGVLLALAAGAAAIGVYLAGREDYALAEPLRDTVPQLLCLPLLGRLLWVLRDPPPVPATARAGDSAAPGGTGTADPAGTDAPDTPSAGTGAGPDGPYGESLAPDHPDRPRPEMRPLLAEVWEDTSRHPAGPEAARPPVRPAQSGTHGSPLPRRRPRASRAEPPPAAPAPGAPPQGAPPQGAPSQGESPAGAPPPRKAPPRKAPSPGAAVSRGASKDQGPGRDGGRHSQARMTPGYLPPAGGNAEPAGLDDPSHVDEPNGPGGSGDGGGGDRGGGPPDDAERRQQFRGWWEPPG